MPVVIDIESLHRTRRDDPAPEVTINGTGFSAANNSVTVGGSPAALISQGVTQVTFNLPFPFASDIDLLRSIHVPVIVSNDDTGEASDDAWIWIKAERDEAADELVDEAIPGPFEITSAPEAPRRFEARDMQRLAALIEALLFEIGDGNVLAWDGTKLAEPAGLVGSGAGQVLLVDAGEPTSLRWAMRLDAFLKFGVTVSNGATVLAIAGNGSQNPAGSPGRENWALDDGTLDLISFRGRSSGGGTVTLVRVLVAGVQQFTSGAIAVFSYSQAINVPVTKGDKVELEVTCSVGLGHAVALVGGIRLLVD